mmetsp:Transcript_12419/g.35536  ORF Transcript_12419/g.35536 Transcript_12419/m.35536 type:complete len:222 (-) Transcript_12419:1040-1705(-)
MPPIINSDVFYYPDDLSGEIAEIEATLRKDSSVSTGSIPRTTRLSSRSVQWGSSLKLNFDVTASPSWVGSMLSSPHFVQRYKESNERQKHDILSSFPSLAKDFSEDSSLSSPPILKKQTRWSKKKELARPIMRLRGRSEKYTAAAGDASSYISSCNETIWFCALSSPTLSSTYDDESNNDSDTAILLNSPRTIESKEGFDRVKVISYEPTPEKKITGRVCL